MGHGPSGYISLGLRPTDRVEAARIPDIKSVDEALMNGKLPSDHVYVGPGHHRHRLASTKWASPFIPGVDCSQDEWLPKYISHVRHLLWRDLPELIGCTLVSDTGGTTMCEATVLAGMLFDYLTPSDPPCHAPAAGRSGTSSSSSWPLRAVLLSGVNAMQPTILFLQESIVLAFRRLFPSDWLGNFKFPFIQDLVNTEPFTSYIHWRQSRGLEWDGCLGPHNVDRQARLRQRHAGGQQAGALAQKAALPPLLSFGLEADHHFQQSLLLGSRPIPTERAPIMDDDLWFAAQLHVHPPDTLIAWRKRSIGALKELKQRWQSVTEKLRTFQTPSIRRVTAERDSGLTPLLLLLTFGLTHPTPLVASPNYQLWAQRPIMASSPPTQNASSPWKRYSKDGSSTIMISCASSAQGYMTKLWSSKAPWTSNLAFAAPLTLAELLRVTKDRPFRLIPRCIIVQSSGKKRIIDNGDTGGQSSLSSDWNKLALCSPLRPAQHVSLIAASMPRQQWSDRLEWDSFESGGEDWPNAYRHTPISENEALGCLVCWWHPQWHPPAFQLYSSLLFGLPLAVTSFNRYSRFVEALGRRLVGSLVSMYFDDANLVDWRSSKGNGQWAFTKLNQLVGTPFATEKRQPMSPQGLFPEHRILIRINTPLWFFF